jgi:predicted ribosome quality control (RQC) complex YloA/Tae2 family protein
VILVDSKNIIIDSLRHTDTEANSYRDVYPHKQYVFPRTEKKSFIEVKSFDMFYNSIGKNLTAKAVADSFVGISQGFVKHIICKFNITNDAEKLYNEMKNIVNSEEYVFEKTLDDDDFVVTAGKESVQFSVNFSIDDFYYEKESKEEYAAHKANMLRKIDVAFKKYNKRLFNIEEKLKECENMDTYRLYGELITANLYKINDQHLESITLPNYYKNNEQEEVPLDKRYSTNVNAKRYFKKYSKLKNALKVLDGQKADTLSELDYIESVKYEIETAKDLDELKEIATEISESVVFKEKAGKNNKKKKAKDNNKNLFKPLKYEIGGFAVYVGRNNKENDWLTTKFAVNSDIWFHAKDIHGSHVILKTNGKNVVVDDNTLVECARLAAKHSKASTSANVPVDYCYVQFVKKPRSANPGMVIYTNNKTLYVTP